MGIAHACLGDVVAAIEAFDAVKQVISAECSPVACAGGTELLTAVHSLLSIAHACKCT